MPWYDKQAPDYSIGGPQALKFSLTQNYYKHEIELFPWGSPTTIGSCGHMITYSTHTHTDPIKHIVFLTHLKNFKIEIYTHLLCKGGALYYQYDTSNNKG